MNIPLKSCRSSFVKTTTALLLAGMIATACQTTTTPAKTSSAEASAQRADEGKIQGFAVPAWRKGEFRTREFVDTVKDLKALGANYVSIHSTFHQDGMRGTRIYDVNTNGENSSPDIEEQRKAVQVAHKAGLKVLLKPHVNLRSGEGWRGDIGKGMTQDEIAAWYKSYDALIVAHARMAQEEGVEMFAVGTELVSTDLNEAEWRNTIAKVRAVYKGPIIYCANHSAELDITWWDALDFIGIDAYYPLAQKNDPTLAELEAGWQPYLESCAALSKKYGKKIIFAEIGYMSTDGTCQRPYDWNVKGGYDANEQADCYKALFNVAYKQPWLEGVFLWNWDITSANGKKDMGYSPEGKPAEKVIREWFAK